MTPGCSGMLNHYTALVWTTVSYIGCYTAVRGDFEVADCRYASSAPGGGSQCDPPNTFMVPNKASCSNGDGWQTAHVPALIAGQCPQFPAPASTPARGLLLQQQSIVEQNSTSGQPLLYSTYATYAPRLSRSV